MIAKGLGSDSGRRHQRRGILSTALGWALLAATAGRAMAAPADSCSMRLDLDYLSAQGEAAPGDLVRARLTLGTAAIAGGTSVTVDALRFFLQCNANASRLLPCVQGGAVVAYGGDETITTTCAGVTWTTGHGAAPRPNQVVFTPSAPIGIPANSPEFCELEFDVTILGLGRDSTPAIAEQVAALGFGRNDAACDNGLRAVAAVTAGIHLCPDCAD